MGTWSVTLYGNDAAADIRGDVNELLRAPLDDTAIVSALTGSYPSLNDKGDEEYCDLWLAMADRFHAYGVAAPAVVATAMSIIDTGLDLDTKRSLGMDERDLAKRARQLDLAQLSSLPFQTPRRIIGHQHEKDVSDVCLRLDLRRLEIAVGIDADENILIVSHHYFKGTIAHDNCLEPQSLATFPVDSCRIHRQEPNVVRELWPALFPYSPGTGVDRTSPRVLKIRK